MAEILKAVPKEKPQGKDEALSKLVLICSGGGSKGDKAFEEIVTLCERGVYETAFCVVKSREDALDISKETFIKLWRLLTEGNAPDITSWYSYILRMARNCTLDFLRKEKIRRADPLTVTNSDGEEKEMTVADEDIESDPVRSYERKEKIEAVRDAIASLDDEHRLILILREQEGRSYEEIAEITGIEMGTVKSRIYRARMQVKKYLEERHFSL